MSTAKTKNQETALTKQGPTSMSVADMPDYLREKTTARGTEHIEAQHMKMPRVAVCQSGTPHRKPQNVALYIEGLKEGDFYNTMTKRNYGPEIKFVPLFFYVSRIMFKGIDEGGGILCQAPDGVSCQLNNGGRCLHSAWGTDGTPPECTEFYNFPSLVLLENEPPEFGVLSLKSTGINAGKELNSKIRFTKKDSFAGIYIARTFPDRKQNQDFFNLTIVGGGWAPEPLFAFAESQYEAIYPAVNQGKMVIDVEGLAGESESERQFANRDAEDANSSTSL